jgi:hypothetical protein
MDAKRIILIVSFLHLMVTDIRTTPVLLFVQPPRFYSYNPPFLIRTTPRPLCICILSGQQPRRRNHNTLAVAPYSTGRV